MGLYAQIMDFDEEFNRLDKPPGIINDYDVSHPEQREALDLHIYTHYKNTDVIESSASCHCGFYHEARYIGLECDRCFTPIQSTTDRAIESTLWMRAPDGVDGLIHPDVWMKLEQALRTKSFHFLRYLVDTKYPVKYAQITSKDTRRKVDKFLAFDPPRGLNNFIRNFDRIIDFLFDNSIIGKNAKQRRQLRKFVDDNKHLFFPKFLPIPSRLCFVVETTTSSTYIDVPLREAMNAINSITSIRANPEPMKPETIQNVSFRASESMAMFYERYTRDRLSQKPGVWRRHVFGGRLHLSARGVITSITEPHHGYELHIPWGMGVQLLKYHILNKLFRRGYTARAGLDLIYRSVLCHNQVIGDIFDELIAESYYIDEGYVDTKGIPCSLQRNPTLQRGSTQQFFISRIKRNVRDNTISMSPLCLRAPNADSRLLMHLFQ